VILIVLPVFNEEGSLKSLLDGIEDCMEGGEYLVVLVDDGSRDKTPEIVASHSINKEVVTHEVNMGLSRTLYDGLLRANELAVAEDIIITMDADDTHDPGYIKEMAGLIKGGSDIVIASRYAPGGEEVGLNLKRKFLSRSINTIFEALFHIGGVKDYTSGYRAYRAAVIKNAFEKHGERLIEARGFAASAELILKLGRMGVRISEFPLVLRYDKKKGSSKLDLFDTIPDYLNIIWKNLRS